MSDSKFANFSSKRRKFHLKISETKDSFSNDIWVNIEEEIFIHSRSWSFNDKTSIEESEIIFEKREFWNSEIFFKWFNIIPDPRGKN